MRTLLVTKVLSEMLIFNVGNVANVKHTNVTEYIYNTKIIRSDMFCGSDRMTFNTSRSRFYRLFFYWIGQSSRIEKFYENETFKIKDELFLSVFYLLST